MKILLAHVVHSDGIDNWYKEIAETAPEGLQVDCFCVTIAPPGPRLSWRELDQRWRQKEKSLFEMYARLRESACDYDVLLLYNGANVHPEFLQYLPTFNVYCCFDDPESSDNLSAPVASAFDAVLYGNIASRFQYEHWGCQKLAWLPIFTSPGDLPTKEVGELLLSSPRDEDICIVGEKNLYREHRLEMLSAAFPNAKCFGNGWPSGKIDSQEMQRLYRQCKVGWNVHNSTGPINRRLFTLPAFGVFQICDNKTGLGQIFRLGEEVVGFDTIPEAIDLTHYYLEHEEERCRIASNGFYRYWTDYHSAAIWNRIRAQLEEWSAVPSLLRDTPTLPRRTIFDTAMPFCRLALSTMGSIKRRVNQVARHYRGAAKYPSIATINDRVYLSEWISPYYENPEMRGVNMAKERLLRGEPFEWPNMLALNWAVTALIRDAKKIIEIGSGTGPFAELASVDLSRELHCFEEDDFARGWAEKNRCRQNITYKKAFNPTSDGSYDLLVSLDVFEHVGDMRGYLDTCKFVAPRAIFSTPNRVVVRGADDMGPPAYPPHVREFTPGEIYWVLRQYYSHVSLYYMPNVFVPWLEPMTILTMGTPIIAECTGPLSS